MTAFEWLNCTDPQPMLDFLRGRTSDRKFRLFAVACCRRIWDRLSDEQERPNVELAERYVEGRATEKELDDWCDPDTSHSASLLATMATLLPAGIDAATGGSDFAAFACADPRQTMYYVEYPFVADDCAHPDVFRVERMAQSNLLRNMIGNPFRPARANPRWLASTVTALAQSIYDDRAFDRTPELADALERAGCTNKDILAHCREAGPHVRGCWALDLVLGKE